MAFGPRKKTKYLLNIGFHPGFCVDAVIWADLGSFSAAKWSSVVFMLDGLVSSLDLHYIIVGSLEF